MARDDPREPAARHWLEARELLGWSQADLASAAGVGIVTVIRLESGRRLGQNRTPAAKASRVREALESAGVEFIPGGARLRGQLSAEEAIPPGPAEEAS